MKEVPIINIQLVNKLESITDDIKVYSNLNNYLANTSKYSEDNNTKYFSEEEYEKLILIRRELKNLTKKLKDKLNN